jgi:predicted Zn-dependent protease
VAQAGQYHAQFRSLQAALEAEIARQAEKAPTDLLYLERLRVMDQELLAAIEMARGEMGKAAEYAREASRLEGAMPFSFGPPFVDLPSAEYLGDLLMASRQFADAAAAYELQLERTRLKPHALEGLARALGELGREAEANYQRAKLEQIRRGGD